MKKSVLYACNQCGCVWVRNPSILVHTKCPACGAINKTELDI